MDDKPEDSIGYIRWLNEKHHVEFLDPFRTHYLSITPGVKSKFENSPFWKQLVGKLKEYNAEYEYKKGYQLLYNLEEAPVIEIKDWDNFIDKTYLLINQI